MAPDEPSTHYNLGSFLKRRGDGPHALAELGRAIELDSSFAEAYVNRGNLLVSLGRVRDAIADYHSALRAKPELPQALGGLRSALEKIEDDAGARAELGRLLGLVAPNRPPPPWVRHALRAWRQSPRVAVLREHGGAESATDGPTWRTLWDQLDAVLAR